MKNNNSFFSTSIILFFSLLLSSCEQKDVKSLADFSGFWVSEDAQSLKYITDGFVVDNVNLGCIYPLIMENGDFFLLDSCVNVVGSRYKNRKYRVDLNKDNQLQIFYDNNNPDIPWSFNKFETKVCELQIVEIRLRFSGLYFLYAKQINVDLVKDEVWINGELKKNTKPICWVKTYCYDEISTKRTDIDFPPAPIGVGAIHIELIFPDGRKKLTTLEDFLGAPLEVQALVLFLVSFLAP